MPDKSYSIGHVSPKAAKYIRRLPRPRQKAFKHAFDELCGSPFLHPNPTTIKKLKGRFEGLWRFRIGEFRVIYRVDEAQKKIDIISIDSRGNVYK